jgi:hypothetical protein
MTTEKPTIPNFLGIGAPKCATTWLSEVLRRHPDVFIAHGKEIVYFSSEKQFSRGLDWYLKHFDGARSEKAIGEFTVSYLGGGRAVAERIHALNPAMKLIAVLRDPVARSFSHYSWFRQMGRDVPKAFLESLRRGDGVLRDSFYWQNLEPFWELFPEEQILLIKYEDVRRNSDDVEREVFRFLGVDEKFSSGLGKTVVGKTIVPRSQRLERIRIKAHAWARKRGMPFLITLFKKTGLSNLYRRLNNRNDGPVITEQEYLAAVPYFAEDVKRLAARTGIDTGDWLRWRERNAA